MSVKTQRILEKFERMETVYGTHTFLGGAVTAEMYGEAGFDALWIDTEHGVIDKALLMQTVIGAGAMATFVRVAWNDMVLVKPILELGVEGIVFPMVLNAQQAEAAVSACRYPPRGIRGFGPSRAIRYGAADVQQYIHCESEQVMVIIQIEHMEAVRNLDEILQVEGIGGIIVGPCDLSGSMGLLAQVNHPQVKAVIDEITDKAKAAGIPFGVSMGYDQEAVADWVRRGASMIFCDNEASYIYGGARSTLEQLKIAFGEQK